MTIRLDPIDRALADLACGLPVVVLDGQDRENEADLIAPADAMVPERAAFFVRHTSGVLCAAMEHDRLSALGIGLMVPDESENTESMRTAFTVTVDAAEGITTGISAADRTRTLHVLADAESTRADLVRPGHIFPLRARPGGVLARRGHTEAGVDLCRLAGRMPVGVLAELVADDGPVMRAEAARAFADEHGLALISIAELITHRRATEQLLTRTVTTRLPTPDGELTLHGYASEVDDSAHLALVAGDPSGVEDVLVRVHSECLTGDALGSRRCDCGPQLDAALTAISREGTGVVVYLRDHEGRGIGLLPKLAAYALQDDGHDTVEANLALGLPADARDYWAAAQILRDLGVRQVRLLTNNPAKHAGLETYGIQVDHSQPLLTEPTADNAGYLTAKRDRLGHQIPLSRGGADPSEPAKGAR